MAREIIEELGLPPDTIEQALADPATSEAVLADHRWLADTYGGFGVPTLVFPWQRALYGPVVAPAPIGDEAMRLWRLTIDTASFPNLYELKAPRSQADTRHFREVFAPTFRARELVR